ncbi:MAG TPA: hypothetical protein VNW95_14555 [Mucilaginibacter sp.]|jgi:hypothetical protein|nr:hypothetical protein [Mucilaginibacter sp.]
MPASARLLKRFCNIAGMIHFYSVKFFLTFILLLCFTDVAIGQKALKDSIGEKEPIAVVELGGAASWNRGNGKLSFGYSIAAEVTPIENWLELELGVSPTYGAHSREWDADLLFKKPWTFSSKVEFMFGAGVTRTHAVDHGVTTNSMGGEIALDFMFWPSLKHQFGWYLEPAYE